MGNPHLKHNTTIQGVCACMYANPCAVCVIVCVREKRGEGKP